MSSGRLLRGMHQAVLDKAGPLLNAVVASYGAALDPARLDIDEAIAQMDLGGADGEFLDYHGEIYGVLRADAETDDAYRARIKREVFRLRVNAHAIEQAVLDETGWDVRIEEPWREMFRLDESRLSGGDKFYDGDHIGYHLIRPESLHNDVDWNVVLPIIYRNKPAGVKVVDWRSKPTHIWQDVVSYRSREWRGSRRTWLSARATWRELNPVVDISHTTRGLIANETTVCIPVLSGIAANETTVCI